MKATKISNTTQIILILSGIGLVVSMFVPIWWIGLLAPQYPEGLEMLLWADKITGDLEKINPLNHYIGMKAIYAEDFWEFNYMRYILAFYALLMFVAAFLKKKAFLYTVTILFLVFGVAFMIDFWWWEYQYGHDLDPTAAIQIPGMTYQPPLIGHKKLLNFDADSYPSWGGSIMFIVGVLLTVFSIKEWKAGKND